MNIFNKLREDGFEEFINLTCGLKINSKYPPSFIKIEGYSLEDMIQILCKRQFNIDVVADLSETYVIKTDAVISYASDKHRKKFEDSSAYLEYTKYVDISYEKVEPIALCHHKVLEDITNIKIPKFLYNIDGTHRIFSALDKGLDILPAFVLIKRQK